MDVMNARVALRERSLLEVLDLTILFVSTHRRAYAKVAAIALLPSFALSILVAEGLGAEWGWCVALIVALGAELPFTTLVSRLVFDDRASAKGALSQALRVAPLAVFAALLAAAGAGAASMILFFPGIYVASITLYLPEAIALEGGSLGAAFGRSARLANTSFGDAAAGALLRVALPIGAVIVADVAGRSIIADLFEFPPPASLFVRGTSVLALLGFWLSVPLVATARFLLYINCRTRTEGWDVQTKFAALALRAEEP